MRSMKDVSVFNNRGSALILVVVLTSLLAMVGAIFLLESRVGSSGSASVATERELDAAVDSVIAAISDELVWDVPGVDPFNNADYFDYPGLNDMWLANLEPMVDTRGTVATSDDIYYWRQISDVYRDANNVGIFHAIGQDAEVWKDYDISFADQVSSNLLRSIIVEEGEAVGRIQNQATNEILDFGGPSDADGDGVADSRWVPVDGVYGHKGEKVYAAIRVVDNGGMLNVNTARYFDPNEMEERSLCDGSNQSQINLVQLSRRGSNGTRIFALNRLDAVRGGFGDRLLWDYSTTIPDYNTFDISDELELRNRFILNRPDYDARIESDSLWTKVFRSPAITTPVDSDLQEPNSWFYRGYGYFDVPDANINLEYGYYDFRHLGTVYNMDRVINPGGVKMVNANKAGVDALYTAINAAVSDADVAAQLAVNMRDCADEDNNVSVYNGYYGFERPYICISEVVVKYKKTTDPGDPVRERVSFGLELVKRDANDKSNDDNWRVHIDDPDRYIDVSDYGKDGSKYQVILFQDPNLAIEPNVAFTDSPEDGETHVDADTVMLDWDSSWLADPCNGYEYLGSDFYFGDDHNSVSSADATSTECKGEQTPLYNPKPLDNNTWYYWRVDDVVKNPDPNDPNDIIFKGPVWSFKTGDPHKDVNDVNGGEDFILFDGDSTITLEREVEGKYIPVDSIFLGKVDWLLPKVSDVYYYRSFKRDIQSRKCIRHLWDESRTKMWPTLGHDNGYDAGGDKLAIRLSDFENIGEIGKVFSNNAYFDIDKDSKEEDVRINVADPVYQGLFKYLTVMDPSAYYSSDPNETRVKGRININTAPWYVIAQLPWVSQRRGGGFNNKLARSIVAYRDRWDLRAEGGGNFKNEDNYWEGFGYTSTGELNRVNLGTDSAYRMNYYGTDSDDQLGFPDLSTNSRTRKDGMVDDFEERDLLFSRISDLVTVRSDVYTAYILVRIGRDGPQRRVMAILDRSEVKNAGGKVKVLSLHRVPDSR